MIAFVARSKSGSFLYMFVWHSKRWEKIYFPKLNILPAYTSKFFSIFITDLNECENNPCQHVCKNVLGSYTCSCFSCYTKYGTTCYLQQCKIGGLCYSFGRVNPTNQCQVKFFIIIIFTESAWKIDAKACIKRQRKYTTSKNCMQIYFFEI